MFDDSLGYDLGFDDFGARRRRRRKAGRRKARAACRVTTVRFKTRRGRVVEFRGKKGPGCPPRRKPSTRHLAPYKRALAAAARACKGRRGATFRRCVAARMARGTE